MIITFNNKIRDVVSELAKSINAEIAKTSQTFDIYNTKIGEKVDSLSKAVSDEQESILQIVNQFNTSVDVNRKLVGALDNALKNIDKVSESVTKSENQIKGLNETHENLYSTLQDLRDKCLALMNHKSVPVVNGKKKCPKCGNENEADSHYCEGCGEPI